MTNENQQADAPVAIIGFGCAGFNAAVALRRHGYDGIIQVFSNIDTLPYSPILTSYYAGGMIDRDKCFVWSSDDVEDLWLDVRSGHPVTELDAAAHVIHTENGAHPYSKCIIATGSTPTPVGFPKDCGYEPLMLRTMDDADRLKAAIENPGCTRILVSGTSMVSLKAVEACLAHGLEVTLVGIMEHVLDMNALPEAATRFEKGLVAQGVRLELANPINKVEVIEDEGHPLGRRLVVTFADGSTGEFDEIFVAHGMRNNLEFVDDCSIDVDRGIIVDEFMRSSDPDVFAAGDVAQATELISGEKRIVGIWKNAAWQGACAGRVIAKELAGDHPTAEDACIESLATNTITVNDTLFLSAGTIVVDETRYVTVENDDAMTIVRVFEDTPHAQGLLVGFNIACDFDEPGGDAYDLAAMMTMQIREDNAKRANPACPVR